MRTGALVARGIPPDYRDDETLLCGMEEEVKLASRFFNLVDFCDANPGEGEEAERVAEDRKLLAELGNAHWRQARELLNRRRSIVCKYGNPRLA